MVWNKGDHGVWLMPRVIALGTGSEGRRRGGVMIWESVHFCTACTANRRGQRRHALSRRAADVLGAQAWRVAGSSQTLLYKAGGHCRDTLVAQAQRDHGVVVYWPTLIKAQSSRLRRGIGLEIPKLQGQPHHVDLNTLHTLSIPVADCPPNQLKKRHH